MLSLITLTSNNVSEKKELPADNYFLPLDFSLIQKILPNSEDPLKVISTLDLLDNLEKIIDPANFYIFTQRESFEKLNRNTFLGEIAVLNNSIIAKDEYFVIVDSSLYGLLIPYCLKIYTIKTDSNFQGTSKQIVPEFSSIGFSSESTEMDNFTLDVHTRYFSSKACRIQKVYSAFSDEDCFMGCNMKCPIS